MYPNTFHFEDSYDPDVNTTGNDGTMRFSTITRTLRLDTNSVCRQALEKHNLENSVAVASSYVKSDTNQYNSAEYKQSDKNELIIRYKSSSNSTLEQICKRCDEMRANLSQFQERLEKLNGEVEHICELIRRESKSEKEGYFYKICGYLSKNFLLSYGTQDNTCSKLKEISKFMEKMKKNFDEQEIFIEQNKTEIENLKHQNKVLQSTNQKLQSEKKLKTTVLTNQINNLQKMHTKESKEKDDLIVHWQKRFDAKVFQCRNIEKVMNELNENYIKEIQTMQNSLQEKEAQLKNCLLDLDKTSSNLKQEVSQHEKLQNELKQLQKLVFTSGNALTTEKEKFQRCLSEKVKFATNYKNKILLKDVEVEAEKQFVTQTVEAINKIKDEAAKYEEQINNFSGNREGKPYLHIREMLVRTLEKLDAIESQNNEEIKAQRKSSIIYIKKLQDELDKNARASADYS